MKEVTEVLYYLKYEIEILNFKYVSMSCTHHMFQQFRNSKFVEVFKRKIVGNSKVRLYGINKFKACEIFNLSFMLNSL